MRVYRRIRAGVVTGVAAAVALTGLSMTGSDRAVHSPAAPNTTATWLTVETFRTQQSCARKQSALQQSTDRLLRCTSEGPHNHALQRPQ